MWERDIGQVALNFFPVYSDMPVIRHFILFSYNFIVLSPLTFSLRLPRGGVLQEGN